ncbi:MAG: U32 family peptidase [Candidatus Schekmanbacteria bacterium]|nr:U32 family peptidase [Candidatus Schekmanbacteria bacterium]
MPELLAPAGGREQFLAALTAGADAVYLGLRSYNARARAENFALADLLELVPLAHSRRMRVYVTVNVVVKEHELEPLCRVLAELTALAVDAIIVQDLGVMRLARRHFPTLRVHASTQLAVHNVEGARKAAALGCRRVVLARELTAAEIAQIRTALPAEECELEVFCHGSLCYSYSGLCLFSGANDARSGNRGECAYTCRQPFRIIGESSQSFLFSMRDLDTSADVELLVKSGADALKIEGRKKDAQYVAVAVARYRRKLAELAPESWERRVATPTGQDIHTRRSEVGAKPLGGGLEPRDRGTGSRRDNIACPVAAPPLFTDDDAALTFQRRSTSLFVRGRRGAAVIDLDNPTHVGVPVGVIEGTTPRSITVRTAVRLERFDGLRITPAPVVTGQPRDENAGDECSARACEDTLATEGLRFSLRCMWVGGRRVATAAPGSLAEIELPTPAAPPPKTGDLLYKCRSADLLRRTVQAAVLPHDYRLRPLRPVAIAVVIEQRDGELRISARSALGGRTLAAAEIATAAHRPRHPGRLAKDIGELFDLFGDYGFSASSLDLVGDTAWFVPISTLKALKRELGERTRAAWQTWIDEMAEAARGAFTAPFSASAGGPPATADAAGLCVKIDRLEYLAVLRRFLGAQTGCRIIEVIFAPKRGLLSGDSVPAALDQLDAFSRELGTPYRLALPNVVRSWDSGYVRSWVSIAQERGCRHFEVGNLGSLALLESRGAPADSYDLSADFTLYALNSQATHELRDLGFRAVTLSVEDDLENIAAHLERWPRGVRPIVIVYTDTPLFVAEACTLAALHGGCAGPQVCRYRELEIENPAGECFVVAHEQCRSVVYARRPYSIAHRRAAWLALGVRDCRVDFLVRRYDADEVGAVLGAVLSGRMVAGSHAANFDGRLK